MIITWSQVSTKPGKPCHCRCPDCFVGNISTGWFLLEADLKLKLPSSNSLLTTYQFHVCVQLPVLYPVLHWIHSDCNAFSDWDTPSSSVWIKQLINLAAAFFFGILWLALASMFCDTIPVITVNVTDYIGDHKSLDNQFENRSSTRPALSLRQKVNHR